MQIDKAGAEI